MNDIVIPNKENFDKIKSKFIKDSSSKLHIVSDFDRTLTKTFVNGIKVPSMISILRDDNYLTKDYAQKAHTLFEKYHPIEIDPKIPFEEKKKAMHEWWKTHFDLLIECKLNKKDIENAINSDKIRFREGFLEFIDLLHKDNIPLVILSSSGLGADSISMFFKKNNILYNNISIISNSYEWDENGYATGVREPIIHILNKDENSVKDFPSIYKVIKDRKNVILLADNLEGIGMVKGFDYNSLIKIAFLNENVEENLPYYEKDYDIIILNDSDMNYVNNLLKEIIS